MYFSLIKIYNITLSVFAEKGERVIKIKSIIYDPILMIKLDGKIKRTISLIKDDIIKFVLKK